MEMGDYLDGVENLTVFDTFLKAQSVIGRHNKLMVSVSGGSDSDIMLDIVEKTKGERQVEYVWYDTGVEYRATKDHLTALELKYGITIQRIKPVKPIPTCVRQYGVPFISKYASEMLWRLQKNGFQWEDRPFSELSKRYPNCLSAVKWWCNKGSDKVKQYNISYNKYLKEFLIAHPPTFRISQKCCQYSKKNPAKQYLACSKADLQVVGVRKAEGGIRASAYKNCFTETDHGADQYRPLFFWTDEDKRYYEKQFGIVHSDCYTKYGLKRTGCVGCPYGKNVLHELKVIEMYEPNLYKACTNIFGASYEYTKQYRQFVAEKNEQAQMDEDQLTWDDLFYDYSGETLTED